MEKPADVTFSSSSCVVVLELKQVAKGAPTKGFIKDAHKQLAEYIGVWLQIENARYKGSVARFLSIMYNDGASYVVEKLCGA